MGLQTLDEYDLLARKILSSKRVSHTDENIGMIVHYVITADIKWNKDIGSIDGFRKMYCDFAFKDLNRYRKRQEHITYVDDILKIDGVRNLSYNENESYIFWEEIKSYLTEREFKTILSKYVDDKTLAHIGKEMGITAEGVRLILKKAYAKIKGNYGK